MPGLPEGKEDRVVSARRRGALAATDSFPQFALDVKPTHVIILENLMEA